MLSAYGYVNNRSSAMGSLKFMETVADISFVPSPKCIATKIRVAQRLHYHGNTRQVSALLTALLMSLSEISSSTVETQQPLQIINTIDTLN